jgi:S1-C subfamily serine protease
MIREMDETHDGDAADKGAWRPTGDWAPPDATQAPVPPWAPLEGPNSPQPVAPWDRAFQQSTQQSPMSSAGSDGGGFGAPARSDPGRSDARRRPSLGRWIVTGIAFVALLAAVAGIGIAIGRSGDPSHTRSIIASPPARANQAAQGASTLDVNRIAEQVDPAIVDITAVVSSTEQDEGTGMILTSNGQVLTNNHVIEGGTSITAQIDGKGAHHRVEVLGTDATDDVALLQIEGVSHLKTVQIGNSQKLATGDGVVAIGNALGLGGPPTVTSGIVSALGRSVTARDAGTGLSEHLQGLIQTDAPINPGNSGGPLVDAAGQVIGMNTADDSGSSTQGATDIGFAIPIDRAISIVQQIERGRPTAEIQIGARGIIGVEVETIAEAESLSNNIFAGGPPVQAPVSKGAYVEQAIAGSPAERAGVTGGDVIVAVNGRTVSSPTALEASIEGRRPGSSVSITWVRANGARQTATMKLIAAPAA